MTDETDLEYTFTPEVVVPLSRCDARECARLTALLRVRIHTIAQLSSQVASLKAENRVLKARLDNSTQKP